MPFRAAVTFCSPFTNRDISCTGGMEDDADDDALPSIGAESMMARVLLSPAEVLAAPCLRDHFEVEVALPGCASGCACLAFFSARVCSTAARWNKMSQSMSANKGGQGG